MKEHKPIIEKIRTEEKLLSELDFNLVDLKSSNGLDEFDYLELDLTELLKAKLEEKGLKYGEDLKVYFDLSYSQGSGFCFMGNITTKNAFFKIEHSGNYYHYNSKSIELINLIIKNKEIYQDEFNKKQEEKAIKEEEDFNIIYTEICKEMAKIGYQIIEEREQENVLKMGFIDFLTENNLNYDTFDYDFEDYKTTEEKGYIKICNDGDTSIKGLWIKNLKVKIDYFVKAEINKYEVKELY